MINVDLRFNRKKQRYSRPVKLPAKPCVEETIAITIGSIEVIFGRVTNIVQYVDQESVSVWIESEKIANMSDADFDSFLLEAEFGKVK